MRKIRKGDKVKNSLTVTQFLKKIYNSHVFWKTFLTFVVPKSFRNEKTFFKCPARACKSVEIRLWYESTIRNRNLPGFYLHIIDGQDTNNQAGFF